MSLEDEMVSKLIEYHRGGTFPEETESVDLEPEAHYNHYGDRGAVDLYVQEETVYGNRNDYLYEVKSPDAIKRSTGANEILRQFNRMRKFFYKDAERTVPVTVGHELCFVVSEETVEHVAKNINVYQETESNQISPLHNASGCNRCQTKVLFRSTSIDGIMPASIVGDTPQEWKNTIGEWHGEIYEDVHTHLEDLGY